MAMGSGYDKDEMFRALLKPEFQHVDTRQLGDWIAMHRNEMEKREHMAAMAAPPTLSSMAQLRDMDRVAAPWDANTTKEIDQMAESMIKTADAFKDVLAWLRAQSVMIQTTYKDDRYRRELHMQVLNEGFISLLRIKEGSK